MPSALRLPVFILLLCLSLLTPSTGADAQRPASGADANGAPAPPAVGATLSFTRAPRAEGAIAITVARQSGPDLTQPLPSDIVIWQSTLPSDWTRITCGGDSAVCLPIDRADTSGAVVQLMAYPRAVLTATWPTSVAGQRVRVMLSRQIPAGERALGAMRGAWNLTPRSDGRLTLDVPQGTLDLRLQTDGCAAVYRFGVQATATSALGVLPCVPGGSIAARVRDQRSGNPVTSCRAALRPSGALVVDETSERFTRIATQATTCTAFGFLQFTGLAPGRYRLNTESGIHAPEDVEVEVMADTEASVDLWLTAFRTLTVRLTPPVAPDGRPWTLRLRATETYIDPTSGWARATVRPNGEVAFSRVVPTDHEVEVYTQDEQLVTSMVRAVTDDDAPLEIAIPLVRVLGRVTQSEQPVSGAQVQLEDTHIQQSFTTDRDGRFSGWIRKPDGQQNDIRTSVTAPGATNQTIRWVSARPLDEETLEVELELGTSSVIATVVDAEGRPVEGISVTITGLSEPSGNRNPATFTDQRTNASGIAIITGVTAGRYLANGSDRSGSVRAAELDVPPGVDVSIQLTMVAKRNHIFQIVSSQGLPLAGDWVSIRSDSVMLSLMRQTDGSGQVGLDVADGSRKSAVTVVAESQMLWSGCVTTGDGDRTRITLPPPATGTLRITRPISTTAAGTPVLLTDRGGILRREDLLRWKRTTYSRHTNPNVEVYEIPGLAAGRYRAILYDSIDVSPLVRANCAGAIPFNDTSSGDLAPGGVLELTWPKPKN